METIRQTTPNPRQNPIWLVIGGVVFLLALVVLFLVLASSRLHHDVRDSAPPGGAVPGAPGQAASH